MHIMIMAIDKLDFDTRIGGTGNDFGESASLIKNGDIE